MNLLGLIGAGLSFGTALSWMEAKGTRRKMILGFIIGIICLIAGMVG